jgi:8-oxo-dGTP pyrophosphatase MutT (NUDIX family)
VSRQQIPRPATARPGGPPPWATVAAGQRGIDLGRVRRALAGRGPAGPPEVAVDDPTAAAVLVPLFEEGGRARVVLTRRAATLRNHQGQIAFPGGSQDPGEDLRAAALRETEEEVGISPAQVEIVGELDLLTTVASRFLVAPFVGVLAARPTFRPNRAEIDRVFDVALEDLLGDDVYREEVWQLPWGERAVPFFELADDTVWGATARILQQLLTEVLAA